MQHPYQSLPPSQESYALYGDMVAGAQPVLHATLSLAIAGL